MLVICLWGCGIHSNNNKEGVVGLNRKPGINKVVQSHSMDWA